MEITHHTRNLPIAPRKLRLVADAVRHVPTDKALSLLDLLPQKGGHLIFKALKAAIDMAKTHDLDVTALTVHTIKVDQGRVLKRVIGHSRGRMAPIMKQHSHLTLVLTGEAQKRATVKAKATPKSAEQGEEN